MSKCGLDPINRLLPQLRFANEVSAYGAIYDFVRKVTTDTHDVRPLVLFGERACGKSRLASAILDALGRDTANVFQGGLTRQTLKCFHRYVQDAYFKNCGITILRDFRKGDIEHFNSVAYDLRFRRAGLIVETSDFDFAVRIDSNVNVDAVVFVGVNHERI